MVNPEENYPVNPPFSTSYSQAKNIAMTLNDREIERLKNDLQNEIDRRAHELSRQQRKEDQAIGFAAWKEKRLPRDARKFEERSEKGSWKKYRSATESESEESEKGFEYHVKEVYTSDKDSDAAEEKRRMMKYYEEKLYRQYEDEKANPRIFARTMREGESSDDDDDEQLEDEYDEDEGSDTSDSFGSESVSPASFGSDYNEQYEEEDGWSYDGDDY